jgi:hypothetical protein
VTYPRRKKNKGRWLDKRGAVTNVDRRRDTKISIRSFSRRTNFGVFLLRIFFFLLYGYDLHYYSQFWPYPHQDFIVMTWTLYGNFIVMNWIHFKVYLSDFDVND